MPNGSLPRTVGPAVASSIPYRSLPHESVDNQVNTSLGSCIVYWAEPDGHVWELVTKSYARSFSETTGSQKGAV